MLFHGYCRTHQVVKHHRQRPQLSNAGVQFIPQEGDDIGVAEPLISYRVGTGSGNACPLRRFRIRRLFDMKEKVLKEGSALGINPAKKDEWANLTNFYRMLRTEQEGLPALSSTTSSRMSSKIEDITHLKEKLEYSELMLVSEIARYINRSPLEVEAILTKTAEGTETLLQAVNQFNEVLYDHISPVFSACSSAAARCMRGQWRTQSARR